MSCDRYLLLCSGKSEQRDAHIAALIGRTGLHNVWETDRYVALISEGMASIPFAGNDGLVIGELFHTHGPATRIDQLTGDVGDTIVRTRGSHLVERFWGAYLAVFPAPDGLSILRCPLGALPAYHMKSGHDHVFASDADLLATAGFWKGGIDYSAFAQHLYWRDLPREATALAGVNELLPGTAIILGTSGNQTEDFWNPWDHVRYRRDPRLDSDELRLRRLLMHTVSAWSSRYSAGLLGLSGGLDSSIVGACLASANRRFRCLTMVTEDPRGDERSYAQTAADSFGAELAQAYYSLDDIDLDRAESEHLPRPSGSIDEHAYARAVFRSLSGPVQTGAFFTGNGGDNCFYYSQSARPVLDRFLAEGSLSSALETARDVARLTGASLWAIGKEARRVWRQYGRSYLWKPEPLYLHPDLIDALADDGNHSWLCAPPDALPGKAAHIAMLLRTQNHLEGFDRSSGLSVINPLMSQPLVEFCLSIPTSHMCAGGRDRAVARAAAAPLLPAEIVERRTKGSPDPFVALIVRHFLPEIRARLLDGTLASRHFFDLPALETALQATAQLSVRDYPKLMMLLDAEAWLNHWSGRFVK